MAKRFLDSSLFEKRWFRKLPSNIKLFYFYMLTKCDHAGMYDVDLELAEFQIGMEIDKDNILKYIGEHIEIIKDDKWFIKKFPEFQYGVLNPKVKAHASVIKILEKNNCLKGFSNSLQRVQDKDKDKVKNKKKENKVELHEILDLKQDDNRLEIRRIKFINELNKEFHTKYTKELRRAFFDYWTEPNKSKTKMRFELEKTWDTGRRLARWANNSFNKQEDIRSYDSDAEFKKSQQLKKKMDEVAKDAADPDDIKQILGV
jgi:hypothetical protein|tara:strand:- start:2327 stop:3103 length:777 start_codon:yes stop_codon:yes gene_type:complete